MTATDRTEILIDAEASLTSAIDAFTRALGPSRGAEVVAEIVRERLDRVRVRRQVVAALAREAAQ